MLAMMGALLAYAGYAMSVIQKEKTANKETKPDPE